MSEQISDELHSDATCEQMQREGVAEAVGVMACKPKLRLPQTLLGDIADCRPEQSPVWAACPQEELGTSVLSIRSTRDIGSVSAPSPARAARSEPTESCAALRAGYGIPSRSIEGER